MANSLKDVDVNTLVLETGRRLELAVRKLVPDGVDKQGKPLTLGPRMRQLKDRLGPDVWRAYEAWSRERNAYTHAEITQLNDEDAFRQNFELVHARLRKLAKPAQPPKSSDLPFVVGAVAIVVAILAYFSC